MAEIVYPVILCGGSGTRLWPLSTPERPKQFLALTSEKPMIAETSHRFSTKYVDAIDFGQTLVVGSQQHSSLLQESLPDSRLILEPFGRNSAPAVAAACLAHEPGDLLLILPADHSIQDVAAFQRAIAAGAGAAQEGAIVTFGIEPSFPATGYGYIKAHSGEASGVLGVERFVEKPALELAEAYLSQGNYFWNAGIFLFRADVMIQALEAHAPDVVPAVRAALGSGIGPVSALQSEAFARAPDISIDYAVMEHAENVRVVPVDMGWSDVGDYQALLELFAEKAGDAVQSGPVELLDSRNVYVQSTGPAVAVSGVEDLVIVATADTVMITPMGDSQAVKRLGSRIRSERERLGVRDETSKAARTWLRKAFDVWNQNAWDQEQGGFVEELRLDGTPNLEAARRIRVQARQVYSFAGAIELGWSENNRAEELVANGLVHIDQNLRHPDGGWVHKSDRAGNPVDSRRDLYDHAFLILAGAAAFKATGAELGLSIAHEALSFVETELRDHVNGGWLDGLPDSLPRRANPHMHMLEAALGLYDATGDQRAIEIADEVVDLFETKFFSGATNVLSEFFEEDWSIEGAADESHWEPGHHYEWSVLLAQYDKVRDRDTLSWRRRLIRHADRFGLDRQSGFAFNGLKANGEVTNSNSRLWHQLEMFRAHLWHHGVSSSRTHEARFQAIKTAYLDRGPDGCWMDEIDSDGNPVARAVPASILYHLMTALSPLFD